jgi:hypothetical protein
VKRACAAFALSISLLASAVGSTRAAAQQDYENQIPPDRSFVSPEHFAIEFRIGPYQPDMGNNDAFDTYFGSDHGPLLGLELDVIGYRVPDVLYLGVGGGIATASYTGKTLNTSGIVTAEDTSFSYLPLDVMAVARLDALAHKLSVPFILTGKLGYEWAHWTTQSGKLAETTGWSVGLHWGAQLALDLDAFDRKAARAMDEEWGINHSFVFFELFGFEPSKRSLPVGNTSWTAGLGFTF